MLNAGSSVVVDVLLNLTASFSGRRFVDRHLDRLLVVRHDDRTQRRVIGMHELVVNRPETMKLQRLLVPVFMRNQQVSHTGKKVPRAGGRIYS